MPVNTGGGALSAGRLHAYGAVHEACTQLWGRAGARQVKGDPHVCATSTSGGPLAGAMLLVRSEEHTSELQSLMRISYAVFCLKKKKETHERTKEQPYELQT